MQDPSIWLLCKLAQKCANGFASTCNSNVSQEYMYYILVHIVAFCMQLSLQLQIDRLELFDSNSLVYLLDSMLAKCFPLERNFLKVDCKKAL